MAGEVSREPSSRGPLRWHRDGVRERQVRHSRDAVPRGREDQGANRWVTLPWLPCVRHLNDAQVWAKSGTVGIKAERRIRGEHFLLMILKQLGRRFEI